MLSAIVCVENRRRVFFYNDARLADADAYLYNVHLRDISEP
jgi:hypothetical protein